MLFNIICALAALLVMQDVNALSIIKVPDVPFIKHTDCGDICTRAFCVMRKREECNLHTEFFVERDGDCYCCDMCIPRVSAPASIDKKCAPDHCTATICQNIPPQECFSKNMAFAPKDNDCSCCDACI